MRIDTAFNFYSDSNGSDPDSASPRLRRYHKMLWSKPLPNGEALSLAETRAGAYLYHKSEDVELFLGSDAITHSYRNHKRKHWLTKQIPEDVDELFDKGSTIGGYIIFPNNRVNSKHTINQARGVNGLIDDRFDLTLECIRLFYEGQESPLSATLTRYKNFFDLFGNFSDYVRFFFLDDLIDHDGDIKFHLPFDGFKTRPEFSTIDQYRAYKKGVMAFVGSRNKRIENYSGQMET